MFHFIRGEDDMWRLIGNIFLSIFFISCRAQAHSIVFIHIGPSLPPYLPIALKQARSFNPDCEIYLLANCQALNGFDQHTSKVTMIPLENLTKTNVHQKFIVNSRLDRNNLGGFWFYTSERFFYLDDFMQQYNIKDVLHLESDNMLYASLNELMPIFRSYYSGIGAVFDNDDRCIPSIVYVPHKEIAHALAVFFLERAYEGKNDMQIIAAFKQNNGQDIINNLPIVTKEYIKKHALRSVAGHSTSNPYKYTCNAEQFNSIFDGAALGQYLGGTDPNVKDFKPGFINESCLFNPSHFSYVWVYDYEKRRVPYIIFEGRKYRINNLHIHSKKLHTFLSIGKTKNALAYE